MKSDTVTRFRDEEEVPSDAGRGALLAGVSREAIDLVTAGPDGDTYQFVVTVAPGTVATAVEQMPTLLGRFTEHLHRVERHCLRLQKRVIDLESQLERQRSEQDRLHGTLKEARDGHRRLAEALSAANEEVRRSELEREQSTEHLARTADELARCQLERRFLRDDVLVKDAYLATLRQQASLREQSQADLRAVALRLDSLTTEHAAEAKRADDLVQLNGEIRRQLERAQQELQRVRASFVDTLAQPRYVVADRCNAWAKKASFLHPALKRVWAAWYRGR